MIIDMSQVKKAFSKQIKESLATYLTNNPEQKHPSQIGTLGKLWIFHNIYRPKPSEDETMLWKLQDIPEVIEVAEQRITANWPEKIA